MFFKRLINAVVTIPLLVIISATLLLSSVFIGTWMDGFEQTGAHGILGVATLLSMAIAWLATFGGAVLVCCCIAMVIITGEGIFWRKVNQHDWLQGKNGSIVQSFSEDKLVWRFDPIFRGRKLFCHSSF